MFKSPFFQKYLLPGFVFQSMVIGGGYGTGRELVEFFLNFGSLGGLIAMWLVATVIWSAVCAVTFELARASATYDYRSFCRMLLGPAWWLYDVCYFFIMLIVLSVVAAAAGSIVEKLFLVPYIVGVAGMMLTCGVLVLKGTPSVEKFLSFWSIVLYCVYAVFFVLALQTFGGAIWTELGHGEIKPGWFMGGVEYAAYNVGTLPAVLFTIRHLESRREALGAGILAGPIAIIPGFFFYLAMVGQYPEVLAETVPSLFLLDLLGSGLLLYAFQIMLLGTLAETGTALLHGFNERLASALEASGRKMPTRARPAVAVVLLLAAVLLAQFGLERLIATGYRVMTYGFWLVYLIPVLTVGVVKIKKLDRNA